MKDATFIIQENNPIAKGVYRMRLAGDTSDIARPGQFVNLKIAGCFLRRPISVCDLEEDQLTIIYKVVGEGTKTLSRMSAGECLTALTGLGNGYDLASAGDSPLLIGGGVGVPPMYLLAKRLLEEGKAVFVALGFNGKDDAFLVDEFQALGCRVSIATLDGSLGAKGFVTDVLPKDYTYFYACGPEPMLKAVYRATNTSGQFSFEERMGCGFGACMGCSCKTVTGYKRICRDGPVLRKEEILWAR